MPVTLGYLRVTGKINKLDVICQTPRCEGSLHLDVDDPRLEPMDTLYGLEARLRCTTCGQKNTHITPRWSNDNRIYGLPVNPKGRAA
jgi:hypothetical protein